MEHQIIGRIFRSLDADAAPMTAAKYSQVYTFPNILYGIGPRARALVAECKSGRAFCCSSELRPAF